MPRLSREHRERAIGMINMSASHAHVARTLGCNRKTVNRLMECFGQTGMTLERPGTGRPRVTTPREDRYIHTLQRRNRFDGGEKRHQRHWVELSVDTR